MVLAMAYLPTLPVSPGISRKNHRFPGIPVQLCNSRSLVQNHFSDMGSAKDFVVNKLA